MNKYNLIVFIFLVVHTIFIFADVNIEKFNHDDLRVFDDDLKSFVGKLADRPNEDRVETFHPEIQLDNTLRYYESAVKQTDKDLSDFDDLVDVADIEETDFPEDFIDEEHALKEVERNGPLENKTKQDLLIASVMRTVDEEQKSEENDNSQSYLDDSSELKHPGIRRMDSAMTIPKVESGVSHSTLPLTILPNPFPIFRRNFAPLPNSGWRMPIAIPYPTTRFTSVVNKFSGAQNISPFNLGSSGITSSQDNSNSYPYIGNKGFVFNPLKALHTLF